MEEKCVQEDCRQPPRARSALLDVRHHLHRPRQCEHGSFGIPTRTASHNTQVGLVFSAFAYPYLIFQIIGGWVSDRFGRGRR